MARTQLPPISEAAFQAQILELAKLRGWRVGHFRRVRVQRKNGSCYYETPVAADGAGFPDLILVRRDRVIFVELKVGRNKPTDEQVAWMAALINAGADVRVWYPSDWNEIERVLE